MASMVESRNSNHVTCTPLHQTHFNLNLFCLRRLWTAHSVHSLHHPNNLTDTNALSYSSQLLMFLFVLSAILLPQIFAAQMNQSSCNFFHGTWVYDPSYTTYKTCPLIDSEFNCLRNGRHDFRFLQYKWKPDSCALPRFDAEAFLQQWSGRKIMFVGDSLSLNMWESLCCMIMDALPSAGTTVGGRSPVRFVTFDEYEVSLFFYRSLYLVDVERGQNGDVLNLNSINGGASWEGMDVLIFNSWHWWLHKGKTQQWDYISDGTGLYRDMNRLEAFYKGLTTWAHWVDQTIDTSQTKVFFQGISPTHYQGAEWGQRRANCKQQYIPLSGPRYPGGSPAAALVVRKVLAAMSTKVRLLDITTLSQLRVDGHPSTYSGGAGCDCSHWCLPGLPDTWNQILYAVLKEQ